MVKLTGAEWLRFPLVPWNVSATVPAVAFAGTANDTCAELLALIERVQEGEQVIPDGNPPMATETDPEKPFAPAMETLMAALAVPACAVMEDGDTEMEKSGAAEMRSAPGAEWRFPLVPGM